MNPQQVIDDSRPMLEEVLPNIGISRAEDPLNLQATLEPFSHWIETQEVAAADVAFLAALIGAFICEFLIEHHDAARTVRDNRIFLQIPFVQGIVREIDPYAVAFGIAQSRSSLSSFLHELTSPLKRA